MEEETLYYIKRSQCPNTQYEEINCNHIFILLSDHEIDYHNLTLNEKSATFIDKKHLVITPAEYIFNLLDRKKYVREIILPFENENLKLSVTPIINNSFIVDTSFEATCGHIYEIEVNIIKVGKLYELSRLETFKLLMNEIDDDHRNDRDIIMWCAKCGYLDMIKYLEELEYDIHIDSDCALTTACDYGQIHVVKYFIEIGSNKNNNCLGMSCRNGHIDIVTYLVDQGVDIDINDGSPLRISCGKGYLDIVKFLIESGADINIDNSAALRWPALHGNFDVVKYLIESGADISTNNYQALIESCRSGHLSIVKLFIEMGADIHMQEDLLFLTACMNSHLDIVKYLIESGVDMNIDNDHALYLCVKYGCLDIIKYFMDNNIYDTDIISNAVKTACEHGQLDVVKYLRNKLEYFDTYQYLNICLVNQRWDVYNYLKEGTDIDIGLVEYKKASYD